MNPEQNNQNESAEPVSRPIDSPMRSVGSDSIANERNTTVSRPSVRRVKPNHHHQADGLFTRLIWFLASLGLVLCVWRIGPEILENYYYAAAKGQARAEYETHWSCWKKTRSEVSRRHTNWSLKKSDPASSAFRPPNLKNEFPIPVAGHDSLRAAKALASSCPTKATS